MHDPGSRDNEPKVAMSVFDQLPDGEFQVELTMKEASLYTLQF